MKSNPIISVIIPIYNVEKYLSRCIESVLKQTYIDYEMILIDDGSTDNCLEIAKQYAVEDQRIVVVHQTNEGLSAARNTGIAIARGDYYTFVDSDDIIFPEYLKELLDALEKNNADISVCGIVRFDEKNELKCKENFEGTKIFKGKEACEKIYERSINQASYVIACAKLYKKELFLGHRYPVGKIHEDQFLTYKLLYDTSKVVEIGKCLYGHYQNMKSITNAPFNMKRYDDIEALEEAEQFFRVHNEKILIEKVKRKRDMLLAEYSIRARNAGVYDLVPEKYKINFGEAKRILKTIGGIDRYEYVMYQFYPKQITFHARLRKIKRILTKKDT